MGKKNVVGVIILLITIVSILILVTFSHNSGIKKSKYIIKTNTECYQIKNSVKNLNLLDDIETSPPKLDKSIFFIDTSCYTESRVALNAR